LKMSSDDALLERITALEKQNQELKELVEALKTELDATEKRLDEIEKSQGGGAAAGGGGADDAKKAAGQAKKEAKMAAKAAAKAKAAEDAKNAPAEPKMSKEEKKAADAAAKATKAAHKEGGKKGQDLCGMNEMGGMAYFTVTMENCEGKWDLVETAMKAANTPVDESGDERKGGAQNLAKCFLSADAGAHVLLLFSAPLGAQTELTLKDWADEMLGSPEVRGEILETTEVDGVTQIKAIAKQNSEYELFPLKQRDAAINTSFAMLKKLKLVMEEEEEEVDMGAMYEDAGIEW